jgi:hypothetical protein
VRPLRGRSLRRALQVKAGVRRALEMAPSRNPSVSPQCSVPHVSGMCIMPPGDRLGFVVYFALLGFWFWLNGRALFATDRFLRSTFCRSMYRQAAHSPSSTRRLGAILFAVGVAFFGFGLYELSQGAFRWRGGDRAYGFSDLIPW